MTSLASSSTEKDEKNSKNTILFTDEIYEKLENGVEVFEKHVVNKEVNAEGNPWKVERDTGNIIVRYSASKTNSCLMISLPFGGNFGVVSRFFRHRFRYRFLRRRLDRFRLQNGSQTTPFDRPRTPLAPTMRRPTEKTCV